MKVHLYDVLKEPLITEKSTGLQEQGKYAFKVHRHSNKKQIKEAVEKVFDVHVKSVNTSIQRGKWRRVRYQAGMTAKWKKAIVTLKEGEKIDVAT